MHRKGNIIDQLDSGKLHYTYDDLIGGGGRGGYRPIRFEEIVLMLMISLKTQHPQTEVSFLYLLDFPSELVFPS